MLLPPLYQYSDLFNPLFYINAQYHFHRKLLHHLVHFDKQTSNYFKFSHQNRCSYDIIGCQKIVKRFTSLKLLYKSLNQKSVTLEKNVHKF